MPQLNFDLFRKKILKEINNNPKIIISLKEGQYSKILKYTINDISIHYRILLKKNSTVVVFKNYTTKSKNHQPIVNNGVLFIYDRDLHKTLKINQSTFISHFCDELKNILPPTETVNLELSNEQKEKLLTGKDVSLTVNSTHQNPKTGKIRTSSFKRIFNADLSFFIGKSTLVIEQQNIKNKPNLVLNKRGDNY